ncbi:DUF1214 domain-containing protein [Novosphingobium mangrovi (ex Huang et al. 2023)]|uniref:DUF1214 domain-containing protein n=1 Tax=Novosphingobium mangrovi (ex Huang et al. 2023) TaxID=2976432 RepID=A0ABT2I5E8_9SPHN|nr:DUF1214 domain-containing protein [Novosphingobium mangrovi (ex Huang et al. 2023)]MCT2400031.1 DUF1214 domain-containing protein [Novosphingobium mangrovi (ex Huang et al. 2023)]
MTTQPGPLFDYLRDLEEAVAGIANTWRPDDPQYRADVYRQIMMQMSYGYFAFFHATPEHPDWAPLWNPVYTLQPNPDDIYLQSPVSPAYSYRVSGTRGTVKMITFNTQGPLAGMPDPPDMTGECYADLDDRHLQIEPDGTFEILLSAERPEGHTGNWLQIRPGATTLMVRKRSYDWSGEVDPMLSIENLDPVPPKPRLSTDEILQRIRNMAGMPAKATALFYGMQNQLREEAGINVFKPAPIGGALSRQIYIPAVYEFEADEALIIETALPDVRPYWNFQLNDPYYNAVEYVYRMSSTNGHFAKISGDGKFRAVISLEDPGVPNRLDPAGFRQGTIYGRWYDCDSCPTPTIKRVKFEELRDHLPADTPHVSPQDRATELQERVRGCQRRRRW